VFYNTSFAILWEWGLILWLGVIVDNAISSTVG
jgi:hypothetical protein